jgi:1A family penicillin-binding protein
MQKKGKKLLKFVKVFFCSILLCAIFVIIFVCSYVFNLKDWQVFDPTKITQPSQSLTIYDRTGAAVCDLHGTEDRMDISIKELPDYVINAFLASEDVRFYEHSGVDVVRIFGALLQDIKHNYIKEGASTITQQLVKQMFLKTDQTISRKIQEALMAVKMENTYSKDQIMEMYLNLVYFGNGAYGIQAAARAYFGVDAKDLTLPQAATLAGVLKSTTNYAPHLNPEKSLYRRDTVLNNMFTYGFLTQEELDAAKTTPLEVVPNQRGQYPYGFYLDMVLSDAEDILGISSSDLLSGGYSIYTSLDSDMQQYAQALYENAEYFPPNAADGTMVQSALVILDNKTGEILSVIGGREHTAMRIFNRATSSRRQPGSSIKPLIVYAPAIENFDYTTTTFLLDEQETFDGFTPSNPGNAYHGWVTLRTALAHSYNLPAIKVLNAIGVSNGMDYCTRVGIPFNEGDEGLTLALGGLTNGVTPLELASAYTPFSNGGMRIVPSCIERITDRNGNIVYQNMQKKYSVLSPQTAYIMTSILETGVLEGTSNKLATDGIEIAAKTGTSSYNQSEYNKDSWIVAYTSEYTICCWMGFDATDDEHVLSPKDTGGNYPALIAKAIFQHIYENRQPTAFTMPDGIVSCVLDEVALEEYNEILVADSMTPPDQTVTEYYKEGTQPTSVSSRFSVPQPPNDFHLEEKDGFPLLSFTAQNVNATYTVYRTDAESKETAILTEIDGANGFSTYLDQSVQAGKTYGYYIQARNKYAISEGKYVNGNPTDTISYTQKNEMSQ